MIKNNKQLEITKNQLEKILSTLEILISEKENDYNAIIIKAQIDALNSEAEKLQEEINCFENLRNHNLCHINGGFFDEFSRIIIQARIAKGWTQTNLSEAIGIDSQQIQRYESTDFESASLSRLYDIVDALDILLYFESLSISKDNLQLNCESDYIQKKIFEQKQILLM